MKNNCIKSLTNAVFSVAFILAAGIFFSTAAVYASGNFKGQVFEKVEKMKAQNVFTKKTSAFAVASGASEQGLAAVLTHYTLLKKSVEIENIKASKPEYISMSLPVDNGAGSLNLLLYKVDISPNGFTLMSSDGQPHLKDNSIVHYRGIIDNNPRSVVSFTFSDNETMGLVCTENGNYVIGKLTQSPNDNYIIYNDRDMLARNNFACGTVPVFPTNQSQYSPGGGGGGNTIQTTKCVNWYWEIDYDIYVDKGSVANVNTYMQAVFNQDAALYANDGISITLQTLYVWSTTDPYTGPGTGDYLNQFGNYRTSFAGDLAHLIGYNGGGGIAWVGGLCYGMPSGRQAYSAIYSTYSNVPAWSWTIECISHEEGHVLGSNHTHDCVWNGNSTAIDGCGPAAGYPGSSNGGNCVAGPIPTKGTIMSYCHLNPNPGIDLSLGFGTQPKTVIINAVNSASCLSACGQGCSTPAQPGTISGTTGVCQGSSQTYSITAVSGATSYTWSYPSGWSGSSTSTSITVTAGGTSGNISVTANNTCGASTARTLATTATALPAQPGTITGSASVCSGAAQTYSITAVSGATSYTWTKPSGWSGTSTTTSISATAGTSGGNMSVVANNSCGSGNARSLAITIATVPAQPGTITGSTSVCPSSSQTYSVTAVSGATSYTWSMPNGWTGSSTTNSITLTAGSSAGNITVSAGNGCGTSSVRTLAVTMGTAVPAQPGNISGNASVCPSTSQTYSVTAVSGATSYTWTKPNGWSGTSTANSIALTAGSTGGTLSVVANNGCGSSTARTLSLSMSTAPAQPGTITGSTSVCQSTSQTYSITAVSGATGYTWTLPNGWSGTSTSTSITTTIGSTGGTISVIAMNGCGSSTARTLTTTVSPTPAQPGNISGSTAVCQTSSQGYSITAVSGATSYTWTLPNGWTGTSTSTSITSTAGSAGGTISVVANNGCGSSTARTLSTSVTPIPAQPASISGNSAVCPGTSQTYSITAVSGATSYTWTLPGGWSGSSTSTSITPITGVAGGSITVKANNGCGSSSVRSLTVTMGSAVPAQPGAISGSATVCQSTSQIYSVAAVNGASSYTWTKPNGWSGTSTTNSIVLTSGTSGGTLSVVAVNGCGNSTARTLSVSISGVGPAQPGAISGNASVCQSTSQTYSITAVSGATSYTWTLPNGWSGTSTSTSITSTTGSSSGTISVVANNGCGSSSARTLSATVSGVLPAQPGSITGSTSVCQTSSQVYSITAVSGATSYTWTLPNGWTGTSTSTSITATIGSAGGTISVSANSGCGSSTARTLAASVSLVPVQPSAISGNGSICSGTSQAYSITAVSGATGYTWTLPNGWGGSSSSTSITASAGTSSGNVTVRANNGCGSSAVQSRSITVSPAPVQPSAISGTSSACPNATVVYSVTAVNGATGYNWSLPSGWNGVSSTNSITVSAGTIAGTISVTATNGCGTGAAQSMAVTTGTAPARPGYISGTKTVCTGSQQTYSFSAVAGATGYIWTLPSGWSGISNTNSISVNVGNTSGSLSVVSVNGCGTSTSRAKSLVVPKAVSQPGSITGSVTLCNGATQTYSVSPVANATSYLWSMPNGWTGSSTSNSINVAVGSTGGVISVRAENACFVSAFRTSTISVKPVPNPTVAKSGNNLVVAPVNATDALQWYFNGSGIAGTNDTIHCVGIGNYSCNVTSSFGCSATSPALQIYTCGPQPRIGAEAMIFSLFPNPAQGAFTLTLPEGNASATVEVYDPYGNLVYKQDYTADDHQAAHPIQLDVAKGIYFVNVRTGGETTMQKLIIE